MACLLTAWWCWLYSTYLSNHLHLMFKKWFCKKFLFCLVHYRPKIYYQVAQCEGISIVLCTLWMKQGELCTNKPRKKIYCCKYYFFFFGVGQNSSECKEYFVLVPNTFSNSSFTLFFCLTKCSSPHHIKIYQYIPKLWSFLFGVNE